MGSYMKIMFNGRRRREWEAEDKMTVTFDNNLVTVSVEQEAKFWFSGKKIGCLTTVSNQIVSAETEFHTVTKSCPTLTRTNGEIVLTDKLDGSNVVGKIATLKCDTESSYQPYKPPGGEAVTVVECLFSTGKYNEKLTTCNKVIAIDYSKLNVGVFFKGANFAATCGSKRETLVLWQFSMEHPTRNVVGGVSTSHVMK